MIIILSLILFVIVMIVIDSNRFVVRTYTITTDKISSDKKLMFLSDLHNKDYGHDNRKLLLRIKSLNPDYVLIGGDIMTAYPGADFTPAVKFTKAVHKDFKLIYAEGNHEYRAGLYPDFYGTMHDDYINALKEDGIDISVNTHEDILDDLRVYSLSIEHKYYRRLKLYPMRDDYIESLLGKPSEDKYNILLAHNPDYFEKYAKWGADLSLGGHVHGGVVRIPFSKGVISPMWKFFPKYDGGLFNEYGKKLIVSRGLGMHTIHMRLFNPAEIVMINLKKA
ncbi:MAG: hypothetical protein J6S95_08430 [Lachnospiraceae bacterium]|nr:hypothetical protein [Lachnospiraceae bacterium]